VTGGRPYVVVHTAVSLDGATTGFDADLATYYELAGAWDAQVTLTGADTLLAQEAALRSTPGPGPAPDGPLLAVVDSRRRVGTWSELRTAGFWSDVLALRCQAHPAPAADVAELVVGRERVDLRAGLEALGQRPGVEVVRVDSGGSLTGALLAEGLVDEVSLVVHPWSGGDRAHLWYGGGAIPSRRLEPISVERRGSLVWLRHRFTSPDA
jgi:2,5-diamino-6-(ribosylamino)-4(3H)-pyrimidinone 5'-phosphate reductase